MDVFFVADDFTGGVDVLLQAARCGQPATMFLSEAAFLAADPATLPACTGVATTFRRCTPEEITAPLGRLLDHAAAAAPRVVQYKICSTADSSPALGSVGPAFEHFLARGARRVALWPAQPGLRRYTAFGHHFANDRGTVYRLDRQPTMSQHPVTPMRESDLRVHFRAQVGEEVGSVTLEDLADERRGGTGATADGTDATAGPQGGRAARGLRAAWRRETGTGHRLVALDVAGQPDATAHGVELVEDRPAFVIGSGGATLGLGTALGWRPDAAHREPSAPAHGPVLTVVGSCSRLTATQIAVVAGRPDWLVLAWDPARSGPAGTEDGEHLADITAAAAAALQDGLHVLVHSGGSVQGGGASRAGADDPARAVLPDLGTAVADGLAHVVAGCAGRFARLVVAGGDTSGDVLTRLGATHLTVLSVLDRDTCLCMVDGAAEDGLEVVLKGGQIGSEAFFVRAAEGEALHGGDD